MDVVRKRLKNLTDLFPLPNVKSIYSNIPRNDSREAIPFFGLIANIIHFESFTIHEAPASVSSTTRIAYFNINESKFAYLLFIHQNVQGTGVC